MILSGKTALVTGCSRGIGLSIAHLLAQNGAKIVANARKQSELEAAIIKQLRPNSEIDTIKALTFN